MCVKVIRNNLPMHFEDRIPRVAVMANFGIAKSREKYVNLFLANPEDLPSQPFMIEMGYTFDQLNCPLDFIPTSNEEREVDPDKWYPSDLKLLPDEILPWVWPDNAWKPKWLIDNGIAVETGRSHLVGPNRIPILKLTPDFFRDCLGALGEVA